jgi:hypothetical protein
MAARHESNAAGDWFVDTSCIDCAAAREAAPGLIVARGGQSVFERQPKTDEELKMAWRARLLCPTASIHSETKTAAPRDLFPQELTPGIYRLGYNARSSFGAHSYLIRRPAGNVMVDSPRWTKALVATLESWGGLSDIVLSHRDDVADADRYAGHFGSHVWIHEWDRSAARYAHHVIAGREPAAIAQDLLAVPVPGHTKAASSISMTDARPSPAIPWRSRTATAISPRSAKPAGIRGRSRSNRSAGCSITASNGCSPATAAADIFRQPRCGGGLRR